MKQISLISTLLAALLFAPPVLADTFECLSAGGCTAQSRHSDGWIEDIDVPEGGSYRVAEGASFVTETGTWQLL